MGFEDEAANSGAELTSFKSKQQPLFSESEGTPWKPLDLLAEKKKELWGFDPVQFAVKGAEPGISEGDPKVEIQAPKRVTGSSMARNVASEPVDDNLQITALKPTKPDGMAIKKDFDAAQTLTSAGGGHIFTENKLVGQNIVGEKKLGTEGFVLDKKAVGEGIVGDKKLVAEGLVVDRSFGGQGISAEKNFGIAPAATDRTLINENVVVNKKLMTTEITSSAAFQPLEQKVNSQAGKVFGPINNADSQFGIQVNPAIGQGQFMPTKSDVKFAMPVNAIPAAQGEIVKAKTFDNSATALPERTFTQTSLPNEQWNAAEKLQAIKKAEGGFAIKADQNFEPTFMTQQTPGNLAATIHKMPTDKGNGFVAENSGSSSAIEKFTQPVSGHGVSSIDKLSPSGGFGSPVNDKLALASNKSSALPVEKFDGAQVQQEPAAFKKNFVQTQIPLETQIGASTDRAKFMPAAQKQMEISEVKKTGTAIQQTLTQVPEGGQKFQPVSTKLATSFNDQGNSAAKLALPVEGKVGGTAQIQKQQVVGVDRIATGSERIQTALGTQTFAQSGGGKKLAAETAPASELPAKFNKNIPNLAQIDKFGIDSQLKAQADKIASGAQIKAQADQSAIKLKGEVAATSIKVPEQGIAIKGGNQAQLDAALQPKLTQIKTGAQPMLENGLQTKVAPVKTGAQPQFENGLQPKNGPVSPIKQNQQIPAESGLQPRVVPIKAGQQTQFDSAVLQPRVSPLTGKTPQDLVAALKPQDKAVPARTQNGDLQIGTVGIDRKNAASIVRTGYEALTTPYPIDRGTRMGTAHVISGDVKLFTGKLNANGDTVPAEKKGATPSQIAALLNNVKDGKGDISRSPSFERLMSGTVKSTQDRYVGGEFLLASMIIAAGAARRMPEQRSEQRPDQRLDQKPDQKNVQATVHGTADIAQTKLGEKSVSTTSAGQEIAANSNKSVKVSPFQQMVDNIAKGYTAGKTSEQLQQLEATRRSNSNQGQSDSVRYITGVELAILLAAGGVTRLRSEKPEAQSASQTQVKDDAAAGTIKVVSSSGINFNNGKQPLNAGADTHVSTQIVANMSGRRSDIPAAFVPANQTTRPVDAPATTTKDGKQVAQPTPDLVSRGERCIPGADVAIAAMLMLGGVTRRRTEERFPANPNELAEKVDRPFRLDRRLGEIVQQAKSFVAREPMPIAGVRATAANIVVSGDVQVPPQYKQGAQETKAEIVNARSEHQPATTRIYDNNVTGQKREPDITETITAPTGWVHETVLNKEIAEEAAEEKLKKVEKVERVQQEGAGSGSSTILYRPIWIIAPGETFVSIAEDHYGDGALAWLIADLNSGKFTDSFIDGKRVIEIQSRQRIELPVASDIEEFRRNRKRHQDAENIITIVTASQLDIELKQASFKQFLGTLQGNLPVPGTAILPQIDLVPSPKPARAAFGMSAPQFASIAAAVSLPLIVPQMDMVQQPADTTTVHVQEIRTESARPEETV